MVAFVDAHGDKYGVEPICKVLPIAPSTYYEHKARQADPTRLPPRVHRDAVHVDSSRRSSISSSKGDWPRMLSAINRPFRALVAVRIPATRSRSPIKPSSSTITISNPLEWPEDLSAERNSAVEPSGVRMCPGAGLLRNSSCCRSGPIALTAWAIRC